MKILILGSGGREHAIAWKLNNEKSVEKIYCAPGNAGISQIAECIDIKEDNNDELIKFAIDKNIDLTIVGPEVPLVNGIVDLFEQNGLRIFGPNKKSSQLEGSKAFSKEFMINNNIPTAKYKEYVDVELAIKEISQYGYPVVIKADGLAAGKGVVIAQSEEEAITSLREMMEDKKFGDAADKIVIEEFLEGIETSILAFVDNDSIIPMESAKDHKKIFDNEQGLNTGGMGTFSPSNVYTHELIKEIKETVLDRTLKGLQNENFNYKGMIFIGLMITDKGAKVLEYNVRFGDPETQSVLLRLKTDLSEIMNATIDNNLKNINIEYHKEHSVCVILASGGYPESYEKEKEITGLDKLDEDIVVFHSGTKFKENKLVTNGGRVLGVCAKGTTTKEASEKVYENIKRIGFEKMHYRNDIGNIK